METVTDFIFLGSKISADSDCSHGIKRRLLLGRKTVTYLDSVLKSKDITFSTKVHIVKVIVFLVAKYGCESGTIKKAECKWIDAFELWCWRRLLRVLWEIKPVNPKGNQPEYSLEGQMLKLRLQYFGHLRWTTSSLERSGCSERLKAEGEEGDREWLDGITDLMDMNLGNLREIVGDGEAWPWCCKESDMT